ncbi:MAG: hypothetical protein HS123_04535 [Solibacteraceae bacterium]|nr:hypothetical protein [Solibacteraceae bacterium]
MGLKTAIANVAMRTNDLNLAESSYRQLIEVNPKNLDLHLRLGEVLRRGGKCKPRSTSCGKVRLSIPTTRRRTSNWQ